MSTQLDQNFANQIVDGVKSLVSEIERLETVVKTLQSLVNAHEEQTVEERVFGLAKAIRSQLGLATPIRDVEDAFDIISEYAESAIRK